MPNNDWLELLIAKLPPFDPDWCEELQVRWFGSFLRLLEMGRSLQPQASIAPESVSAEFTPQGSNERWRDFSGEELATVAGALLDSSGMRSDTAWYNRCHKLRSEVVAAIRSFPPQASAEGDGLAKARGTSDTPESGVDASTPSKEKS